MVSFAWPWAFLLLPLPLLVLWRSRNADAGGDAVAVPPVLAQALGRVESRSSRAGMLQSVLLWLAWLALIAAVAQPSLVAGAAVRPASGRAMVVAIDLSSSMGRRDFVLDGRAVDRLTALKSVARAFIAARRGDRIGLVLFGDEAFAAAPVSYDLAAVSNALEESAIGMAGRATAIGDALGLAIVKLRDDPAPIKTVVLLSDGTNNSGQTEPEDAARLAATLGIRVLTIGLGSEKETSAGDPIDPSADLDEATLQRIATASGGTFFRARTTEELAVVYGAIDAIESSAAEAPPVVPRLDIRNWLLLALAGLLAVMSLSRWRRAWA